MIATLDGVTKRYGDRTAVDDLTLALEPGAIVALLGPNGAGKSTLVSLLVGLRRPDAGCVRVLGGDPRAAATRAGIGVAPQELQYPATLRVRELVTFVARHFAGARGPRELLTHFGLAELGERQAGGLSVGQRRKLGLVLAFVGDARLVVLDEPTASLDAEGRAAVWRAVRSVRQRGSTVLVATHDLTEAEAVADRVLVIDRGRLLVDGAVAEVKARAGLAQISFDGAHPPPRFAAARCSSGRVTIEAADPGAVVAELVAAGIALPGLEVRRLTLEEALARLGGRA